MPGWRWLVNPSLENSYHRISDDPAVLPAFTARGWEPVDIDGDLARDSVEFDEALARLQAEREASDLRGKALDEALENAGLSKAGTVDEKRARLAQHETTNQAETSATENEGSE